MMNETNRSDLAAWIRTEAERLGIDRVGFCSIEPGREADRLREWLSRGYHGSMEWLARDPERRGDPRRSLAGARTALVAAALYDTEAPRTLERAHPESTGWISRYAWGDDYHDWLTRRLRELARAIDERAGDHVAGKVYVDTGPVQEKALAERAGLGWIGKNACLISPGLGSFVFLGVILLTVEIAPDDAGVDRCGTCRACLDVCPTSAFPEPYVLDARRCISYLTIEHRGEIDPALEPAMGTHVFGCDLCQDVCPWNRRSPRTATLAAAEPRAGALAPDLAGLARLDAAEFADRYRGSPVKRTKRAGLMRNVAVALGNAQLPGALEALEAMTDDEDSIVVTTATRSIERLRGRSARPA